MLIKAEIQVNSKIRYILEHEQIIEFRNGLCIEFFHDADCCENNFADLKALQNTGIEDDVIEVLTIEPSDYGFRLNGYFVPCYSAQNGYYTTAISCKVTDAYSRVIALLHGNSELIED